jgi:hypothetical protein
MSNIKPPKVLFVNVTSSNELDYWFDGDSSDAWYGSPFRWTVNLTVTPQSHSDTATATPMYYTGDDIEVGDWIATGQYGVAVQIVSIVSKSFSSAEVVVEDIDRFNTFADPYQNGTGGVQTGNGYLFQVSADGDPVLLGIQDGTMPSAYQTDLIGRFSYRNFFNKYIRVNQPGHSFEIGDIVRVTISGNFELAAADLRANSAIGIVNSVGIPSDSWFTFRPLCQVINDVEPPLVGSYGDLFFLDPLNPGKLTTTLPEANARPIYMRLDSSDRALLLDAGMFDYVLNNPGETNKYDVEEVTAGQTEFHLPNDCTEVMYMSINGIENENFTFDLLSKVLVFDPVETGYGIDVDDEVFFIYKS